MRTSSCLVLPALLACATAAPSRSASGGPAVPEPSGVVATTASFNVTSADLEAFIQKQPKLAREYYDLRRGALEEMVAERLVEETAKKLGVSGDTWLANAIELQVKVPSDAEIKAFFDTRIAPENPRAELSAETPRIKEFLLENRRHEAMGKVMAQLRADNHVQFKLAPARVAVSTTGPSRGPTSAPLTLVEFADYQCPYCQREEATIKELLAAYPTQLRLVVRDFPLNMHPYARGAARAAICADEQNRFWDMHDKLYADPTALDPEGIERTAKSLGLDQKKFDGCLKAPDTERRLEASQQAAEEAGVDGTPALFLNGRPFAGAMGLADLKAVVDEELASQAAAPAAK